MKKQFMMIAVALMTAGVLTTGCSNDDAAIENPTEQTAKGNMLFTATIAPKDGNTRSVNADGVTTWVENERITVYYQKTDDSYGTAIANVDAVNEGMATISAALSDAKDGGTVKFVYPASLVNATGDDIDATKLAAQHGTIADISANFDAATASAILNTNGTICGTTETIAFTNRVLIGKFTPKLNGTAIDEITTLTVTAGTQTYTITPESPATAFGDQGIYVAMLPVSDKKVSLSAVTSAQTYIYGGKNVSLSVGKMYNNLAVECYPQTVNLATIDADYTALDGQILTGTLEGSTQPYKISIADGAAVTLDGVTINGVNDGNNYPWAGINCEGDATIILKNGSTNVVKGFRRHWPGIYIAENKTLTIQGNTGTLAASPFDGGGSSGSFGAGIGGGGYSSGPSCGNIVIEGGIITATGGQYAAGIGCGTNKVCGSITISGGTVTAYGNAGAAGIGSGNGQSSCGNITISGTANVTSSCASNDGTYSDKGGAGIGSGFGNGSYCGDITIMGGIVTATGGYNAAGIGSGTVGSGNNNYCGNISITGGTITAEGKIWGAGIGSGYKAQCGTITIGSGIIRVSATSNYFDAKCIGAGLNGTCGTVTVDPGLSDNGERTNDFDYMWTRTIQHQ